ncbi:MAG: 16S rRNA (cytidine(1402)-2'-O)-methyltransferase [Candidatus Syntrophosphaera sp.]|nr:16S rRNA (cytidine(1402)-2'-O)-methyltransferase [Candidatus Syntrophosphaera sp.]
MPAGCIHLVPVPIGNLGDITLRALEILKSVNLIAAEDTRKTRFLLSQYEIQPPRLLSLHKYNELQRLKEIFALLEEGNDIAVVTDAGSPGISDPAMLLIQNAIERQVRVVPLPGATALVPALTASGLDTRGFLFLGFLPLKLKDRKALLDRIRDNPFTTVLYEAPHRIRKTLADIHQHCGNRRICLAREISKLHEEFIRGDLESILADYEVTEKGEFVVILDGAGPAAQPSETEIAAFIRDSLAGNKNSKAIAEEVSARFGLNRNSAYKQVLAQKEGRA